MSKLATLKMYLRRQAQLEQPTDLYAHRVTLLGGGELDLADWRGAPTLFVNTASKCGFTPQYEGLQSLYARYHERGLNILGTPSADFADQEFEDAAEIDAFCQENYGVQFPLTARTSVRQHPDPLWQELTSQPNSAPPKWNFTKYLVGADGHLIDHWGATVKPQDEQITAAIEAALG
ncbi:MAG: glutathione peroxidase [Acidobacteriota bacterium]|nr:glutathione peroxidase [Acidobacteriota bacterium]